MIQYYKNFKAMNYKAKPSANDIRLFVRKVNKEKPYDYQNYLASIKLTKAFLKNDNYQNIYIKVNFINGAFRTSIGDTLGVSKHIKTLKNIDKRLNTGDVSLIKDIAEFKTSQSKEKRRNYSFATKYCHCHRPDKFSIYDKYVRDSLFEYNKYHKFSTFTKKSLTDYVIFKRVLADFKTFVGDNKLKADILDRFLWTLGKWKKEKKDNKKLSG